MDFDWNEIAFGSKKALRQLKSTFIVAPREISKKRLAQLIKTYLPKGHLVLGISKDKYVAGLEGQPQFKMLRPETVQEVITRVRQANAPFQLHMLTYNQRDLPFILEKIAFRRIVFINGSWYRGLHLRSEYYILSKQGLPFDMASPFADEAEAKAYATETKLPEIPSEGLFTDKQMIELAQEAACHSYDYASFQTGSALGRRKGRRYELLATSHNKIAPYETYAMHFGSEREKHFSPMHDLNYYDTIHFEVMMLITAQKRCIDLANTTLFANVLPCPHCSRMLAETDIAELVYREDHSDGYAVQMLEHAGKKVRRLILPPRPEV
ncbi:MAG TPA: hypothetical protein VGS08_05555 [Candidatus Saccharimonadales bacterium]|nr:hypothetical protein [Candidatus Saccharimonadales bacterium]